MRVKFSITVHCSRHVPSLGWQHEWQWEIVFLGQTEKAEEQASTSQHNNASYAARRVQSVSQLTGSEPAT